MSPRYPFCLLPYRLGIASAFWLACCWIFCMLAYVGLPSHEVSFGNKKRVRRALVLIKSMLMVSVLGIRLMACACGSRCLSNARRAQSVQNQNISKIMSCLSYTWGWLDVAAVGLASCVMSFAWMAWESLHMDVVCSLSSKGVFQYNFNWHNWPAVRFDSL